MKNRNSLLDIKVKYWDWSQWIATIALIIFIAMTFSGVYFKVKHIEFRTTLLMLILVGGAIFNYAYVLGLHVDLEDLRFKQYLLFPVLLVPIDMLMIFLLGRAVKIIKLTWWMHIKIAILYILFALIMYVCYKRVIFEYVEFTDQELKDYGID